MSYWRILRYAGIQTADMSSSTKIKTGHRSDYYPHEDSVQLVVARLLWIATTTIGFWIVVGTIAFFTQFPPIEQKQEGLGIHEAHILSVQFAAALLIAHFLSVIAVQVFAPRAVNRCRLASNTMFSLLVLTICVSISVVARLVPAQALPYLKPAFEIAFQPTFVIANLLLCGITGLMIYWSREMRLADMVEIYWGLGLMFLLSLSTALVMAVVSI